MCILYYYVLALSLFSFFFLFVSSNSATHYAYTLCYIFLGRVVINVKCAVIERENEKKRTESSFNEACRVIHEIEKRDFQ